MHDNHENDFKLIAYWVTLLYYDLFIGFAN